MLLRSKIYLILNQEYVIHSTVLFLFLAISLKICNFCTASGLLLRMFYPLAPE